METIGIIPARYNSSRLPGKPLVDINGTSMIMRVYRQAQMANLDDVIVATDDQRILDHVAEHGGKAVMTSKDHPSGTDRCLEATLQCKDQPYAVINIQGDEPFIEPEVINKLAWLLTNGEIEICTLVKAFSDIKEVENPNRVKVVLDKYKKALYFSRSVIPYNRNGNTPLNYWQHIGIYGYQLKTLKKITSLPQSSLELAESLEQLRWLENGFNIHTAEVFGESLCVDTEEDLAAARAYAKSLLNQ